MSELPFISQNFSSDLLSIPCPKFRDDEETLWKIFTKIVCKQKYSCPKTVKLKKEFVALYESIKKKKEDPSRKVRNKAEDAFYRLNCTDRRNQKLLIGLRFGRGVAHSIFFRKNMPIKKTKNERK